MTTSTLKDRLAHVFFDNIITSLVLLGVTLYFMVMAVFLRQTNDQLWSTYATLGNCALCCTMICMVTYMCRKTIGIGKEK